MVDLNTLLPADSGWFFGGAFGGVRDINDAGQIVGLGHHQSVGYRAFLLTPDAPVPEPATYVLCGLGLAGLALLRRAQAA